MATSLFGPGDYAAAGQALFPRGAVWPTDPASSPAAVLAALAQSLADVDSSAQQLLLEAFPTTAVALLGEWEQSLGLPDPCAGEAPTVPARQAQVGARLLQPGGQSAAFLTAFAASLGFTVTVSPFAPFRVGLNSCTDLVASEAWAYALLVTAVGPGPQPVLECELSRTVSAEVVLSFDYDDELSTEGGMSIVAESGAQLQTDFSSTP